VKSIIEKPIGGDGGKVVLDIDAGNVELKVSYPLAKVLSPVTDIIDVVINKVEAAIPGEWDKAVLEPIRLAAKAELIALLSE
jgi:hypothetical protein